MEQPLCSLFLQWFISQQVPQFEDVKFEAASILSELYCQQVSSRSIPWNRSAFQWSCWFGALIFSNLISEHGGLCKASAAESHPDLPADSVLALQTAVPVSGM